MCKRERKTKRRGSEKECVSEIQRERECVCIRGRDIDIQTVREILIEKPCFLKF